MSEQANLVQEGADRVGDAYRSFDEGFQRLQGRAAEAEHELRRLLEIRPDYTAAHRELGRSLLLVGKAGDARDVLERGSAVPRKTDDLQTGREMSVLLRRAECALKCRVSGDRGRSPSSSERSH